MSSPSYLATFAHEAEDLLGEIEGALLALEATPGDAERMQQLFRAFHTLKGSAGVAGARAIAAFTHHVETALDLVRAQTVALTPPLVSVVLASKDHVAALLAAELGTAPCDLAAGEALVARLGELTATRAPASAPAAAPIELPRAAVVDYLVAFAPGPELAQVDLDLGAFAVDLAALGDCTVLAAPAPPPAAGPWPPWTFLVSTARGADAIRDVFVFVEGAGALAIDTGASDFAFDAAPEPVTPAPPALAPLATAPAARAPASAAPTAASVRVSSDRLDHLVQLIGELVITQSRLQQAHSLHPSADMAGPVESFERLIADLRDGVLGLRMVPVGTLFARFHRLVRDLSGELGKDVQLVTAGDDTELDKAVIDPLGDALVHLLRNSMDHGIETPDVRRAAGKPPRGTLRLAATHEGTHVVIAISDDGRGIDLAAVRAKAIAQGLIAETDALSEKDTLALVLRPGFSTAATVTELSGRGVGMDVVKRSIEKLRGTLAITSTPGAGTTIRLTLPLTLAIIDGLLVEIAGDRYIVPLAAVTENLELDEAHRRANNGRNVVAVRGELVPYIRLRELYDLPPATAPLERIVVVAVEGQRVGLVVDRVIGSHQTVIQPLGRFYRDVELFSGTTIMGDGRVAMIVDLAGTVRASGGATTSTGQRAAS